MMLLLTAVASLTLATAPGDGSSHLLRVALDTAALSALPPSCFREPTKASHAPAPEQDFTWVLRDGQGGSSTLESGAPSFTLGDAGRVSLPQQLLGSDARYSLQSFQARVEGSSIITHHTTIEIELMPGEERWTGTLTLSARDECRGGTCQLTCEVKLPFTARPVPLSLARAAR
ncbi:hypothetical protein JQX13_10345 [Archangium violaceum]|uniref:hypothetical protein n=1 Tax=Archangium violaceum TaxID=83451 RepID=UPI00193B77F8|nr:hypothetical protein [Archangium violaceum]QRK10450.1 hypothetical protein JQX13_10345 [Archangium violaceum]